jgi:SAM-dependent methyltransferase
MGTGCFLERLMAETGRPIEPFGLDLSEKMVDVARTRLPNLAAVVDDAEHLDSHFPGEAFDLISTHFVTGFVPAGVLAPKIWDKLAAGGYWSLVGGTKQGFPALQSKANSRIVQWLFGGRKLELDEMVCNPADLKEATRTVEENGFVVQSSETFEPSLQFRNLNEFLDFAYYGGWLAPFLEELGLHEARMLLRLVLNTFVFPVKDNHSIVVVMAQKAQRR